MVVLVVASPCALVMSTPAAILSAIANAARHGILLKGGVYFENMAAVPRGGILDKTGTLTTGKPGVTDVCPRGGEPAGFGEDHLLAYGAHSSRDRSIRWRGKSCAQPGTEASRRPMTASSRCPDAASTRCSTATRCGSAATGSTSSTEGRPRSARGEGATRGEGKSALILHREIERGDVAARTRRPAGGSASSAWPTPCATVCRRWCAPPGPGVRHGDADRRQRAGRERRCPRAGIDEFHANLLPEEKVARLADVRERCGEVMMIGDGINDAPALANASVGVAMGAAGSDVALESAHCVLMGDDLRKVVYALDLSRRAVRTVRWNLAFSFAVILALIGSVFLSSCPCRSASSVTRAARSWSAQTAFDCCERRVGGPGHPAPDTESFIETHRHPFSRPRFRDAPS